jgi:hypothetical protein
MTFPCGDNVGLDCVSADILPPLKMKLVCFTYPMDGQKKRAVKNGSPKKRNQRVLLPECLGGSKNNIVQTLGVILHKAGILSRFL